MTAVIDQNKKILIITYYWPPAGGPGVQRWLKFVKYFPQFGYTPVVITVDEKLASYAMTDTSLTGEIPSGVKVYKTKTRELFNLYLKLTKKKSIPFSGFVHEGKTSFKENFIRFLRTHLFIPDPRKGWNHYAIKKATEIINQENINYIVTTSPPHSSQLIGLKLKKKFPSITWLADFRDPWTHIFFFNNLNHTLLSRKLHKKLEEKVIASTDKIVVVSNSMKKDFLTDHHPKIAPDKIQVITNGYDEEDFKNLKVQPDKDFTITYTGTLADNYRIDGLIEAVVQLNRDSGKKIKLRFVGEICGKYQAQLHEKLGSEYVEVIAPVSHQQAIEYLLRSQMLLLVIPDAPHNKSIITGKLFEYLAAKKPILGIGPVDGDAAEILQQTGAGKMFGYEDRDSIKKDILIIMQDINSYHLGNIEVFSRKRLTSQFISIVSEP